MAITNYRYRWRGCDDAVIRQNIDPAIASALTNAMPKAWMDVQLDPGLPGSSSQVDLDAIMLQMGWVLFAIDPQTPLRAVTEKQEFFSSLILDASTASPAFATLLTVALTTDAGFLDIESVVSGTGTVPASFRLVLDGVPLPNGGATMGIGGASAALAKRVAITPGAHVVELQWKINGVGLCEIYPQTREDGESAGLSVREVVS